MPKTETTYWMAVKDWNGDGAKFVRFEDDFNGFEKTESFT